MNIDPNVVDMAAKFVAVNAVATLVLAVLSYAFSAVMLDGLDALDRWLSPSRAMGKGSPRLKNTTNSTEPRSRGFGGSS